MSRRRRRPSAGPAPAPPRCAAGAEPLAFEAERSVAFGRWPGAGARARACRRTFAQPRRAVAAASALTCVEPVARSDAVAPPSKAPSASAPGAAAEPVGAGAADDHVVAAPPPAHPVGAAPPEQHVGAGAAR